MIFLLHLPVAFWVVQRILNTFHFRHLVEITSMLYTCSIVVADYHVNDASLCTLVAFWVVQVTYELSDFG